jgi:hypothetical protein
VQNRLLIERSGETAGLKLNIVLKDVEVKKNERNYNNSSESAL